MLSLEEIQDIEKDGYRVLRPINKVGGRAAPSGATTRRVALLSMQTTGLNKDVDEITEMALLKLDYDVSTGDFYEVVGGFHSYNDPRRPISDRAQAISKIDNDLVADKFIDAAKLSDFCEDVDIYVGFNSSWARPFLEQKYPSIFVSSYWMAINSEIDWVVELGSVPSLSLIAHHFGFHFSSHMSIEECYAMAEILQSNLASGDMVFNKMLVGARATAFRIVVSMPRGDSFSSDQKAYLSLESFRWRSKISVLVGLDGSPEILTGYVADLASPEKGKDAVEALYKVMPSAKVRVGKVTPLEKYKDVTTIKEMIS